MIRLWISDSQEKLLKSFSEIANSEQQMEVDGEANGSSSQHTDNKLEENSGVEFPGMSVEPYIGSSLAISDHDFTNEMVIVEIKNPNFAFKYEEKGRV